MADTSIDVDIIGRDKASDAFDRVGRAAEKTGARMESAAERTDNLDSKMGAATGGLGALSSGFELVGMEKYAGGLMAASMATDFFSGVGQLATLALQSQTITKIKDTVATVANTIATKTAAAASKAWAAAQWVLNAAMTANPIGLVIAAIVALVAVFVLAWKKSDTFRRIVTGAFDKVKEFAATAVGWIRDNWPLLLAILTGPIGLAVLAITKNWDKITAGATAVKNWIVDKFTSMVGFFTGLPKKMATAVSGLWDGLKGGFRNAINAVIGWWNSFSLSLNIPDKIPGLPDSFTINTPNIPYLAQGGVVTRPTLAVVGEAGPEAVVPLSRAGGMGGRITIIVNGALDPSAVAKQIETLLARERREKRGGMKLAFQ